MSGPQSQLSNENRKPHGAQVRYSTPLAEYVIGAALWVLVIYGWRRAVSFSSHGDLLNAVGLVIALALASSVLATFWIWNRTKSSRKHAAQTARTSHTNSLLEVAS
jgi:hypothetical protein